ncbi:hypothetical protein MKY59_21025 [Paenibacillus sp. FSL W8-0426]|uniref:hypothetical protein n=1 Tax=Paenibacillus sp. FSL W8-0426 TaxID=2921714 RepID=UPI0030DA4C74
MKYPVEITFREKPNYKRYEKGGFYETDDQERVGHLQREGYIGAAIEEKPKTRGRTSGKGKSDDPGGGVNESSKAEPEDTPSKEE